VALPWFGPGRRRPADGRVAEPVAAGQHMAVEKEN